MSKIKSSYHSPACIKLQYIPIMLFKKKMNLKLSSSKLAFSVLYFSHTGTNTVYHSVVKCLSKACNPVTPPVHWN